LGRKVIGKPQLQFLDAFGAAYVDFNKITVPGKNLTAASGLHPSAIWLRTALLAYNLQTAESKEHAGKKGIADNWGPTQITELKGSFPDAEILAVETFLTNIMKKYDPVVVECAPPEVVFKLQCRFLVKAAALVLAKAKRDEWMQHFCSLEDGLRRKLNVLEVDPVGDKAVMLELQKKAGAAAGQKKAASCPKGLDTVPALAITGDGEVIEDLAHRARVRGLSVGSVVRLTRKHKEIAKGSVGTIAGFDSKSIKVLLDTEDKPKEGDKPNEDDAEVLMPLSVLEKYERPKKEKKAALSQNDETPLPAAVGYVIWNDELAEQSVKPQFVAFNLQAAVSKAPTKEQVILLAEPTVLVAARELEPLELKLVPYSADLKRRASKGGPGIAGYDIMAEKVGVPPVYWIRSGFAPQGVFAAAVDEKPQVIDLAVLASTSAGHAKSYGPGCCRLDKVFSDFLELPLLNYSTEDQNFKAPAKKSVPALKFKLSYWTNTAIVPRGCAIYIEEAFEASVED